MKRLVVGWLLIGSLGYFILPWYVVDDGFFSLEWLLYYDLEDYGPAIAVSFVNNQFWLLPLIFPLLFPLIVLNQKINKRIYSLVFITAGVAGFIYFFFQGFSIGIRGWNYEIFENIFGSVNRQYGMGMGALFMCSTFVFYIMHGLASRGWLNGDNFIVSCIGSIIILVTVFVFFPIARTLSFAFKSSEGGYELINFSDKFFNKGIWGLDCIVGPYTCGVIWNTLMMGTLTAFSSTFFGLAFACLLYTSDAADE